MNACPGEKGLPSHIATTWNYRWGFYGGSETFTWDLLHKASRGAVRRGIHYLLPRSFAAGGLFREHREMDLDQRTGEDPQGRPVAAAAPLQDAGAGGAAQAAAASAPGAVLPAGSSGGQDEGDASRTLAPAAPLGAPEPAVRRGPWTDRREVTGWDGTFEEAVDADVIPRPPPLNWNRWQRWRSDEGGGPTIDIDGYSGMHGTKRLYTRV